MSGIECVWWLFLVLALSVFSYLAGVLLLVTVLIMLATAVLYVLIELGG